MDRHLLIEGAAAIILVIVGGFFVFASWRSYARAAAAGTATGTPASFGRGELVPLVGVPLFGLVLILALIALASAGGSRHDEDHGVHGRAPVDAIGVDSH